MATVPNPNPAAALCRPHYEIKAEIDAAIQLLKALMFQSSMDVLLCIKKQGHDVPATIYDNGEIEIAGTRTDAAHAMQVAFQAKTAWVLCADATATTPKLSWRERWERWKEARRQKKAAKAAMTIVLRERRA